MANEPCGNTYYETFHNGVQAPVELSKEEAVRLDRLMDECASEALLSTPDLLDDMIADSYKEIRDIMRLAIEQVDSYSLAYQVTTLADTFIERVKLLKDVIDKANEKLNEESYNGS